MAISSRKVSIQVALASVVDVFDASTGTANCLYLCGIVVIKLGSRSKPSEVCILTVMLTNEIVEDHTSNHYHFLLPHGVVPHPVKNLPLHFQ